MFKENDILKDHKPCSLEIREYILKWDGLEDYVNQERALDKLFLELCKDNHSIENIIIKCSALNDFYSFASKYCSHHRPDIYPIYDSYVHKLLKYFRDRDGFTKFKEADLKTYQSYTDVILAFRKFYGLDSFTVKEIDKYLWQLGKEAFNRYK